MIPYDVAIIGGGAASLMCAIEAGKRGRRVVVIEHCERVGKKILISGGGRCNFTNLHVTPENFLSANPHFCKSALARYTQSDFITMVERHGISYHEKELGQLFCDQSAKLIVKMLMDECRLAGVGITVDCEVSVVERGANGFVLKTNRDSIAASSLVIACGGLSVPKMGATSLGYELAKKFGHRVVPIRAGLVPLIFSADDLVRYKDLSGVALSVRVECGRQSFANAMLFTHRGISGPVILQISSYWKPGTEITLDFLPDHEDPKTLPRRFLQTWNSRYTLEELHKWRVIPSGTEGYAKAEVTAGGVDTRELSSQTMEARLVPGLYFIGEVVDVTGQLGGFNFQWAWASGFVAGQAV